MKSYLPETKAAFVNGTACVASAVWIDCTPAVKLWTGFGPFSFTEAGVLHTFAGVGDLGRAEVRSGSLGGNEQGAALSVTSTDPDALALSDANAVRGAPAVLWALVFDKGMTRFLQAIVDLRGRVDDLAYDEETPDSANMRSGRASLTLTLQGASRGLGRAGQRMFSDADVRLVDPNDPFGREVTAAPQTPVYVGGKPPVRAASFFPGAGGGGYGGGGVGGGGGLDSLQVTV